MVSVGFGVLRAVRGDGGGASSPQAAVEDLGAALEAEDPIAALATMNPEEVEALGEVYNSAAARARRLGFAPRAKTFSGVEITLEDITYRTEDIGPDAARVTITDGRADLAVDRRGLADATEAVLDRSLDDDAEGDTLTGDLRARDLAVEGEDATIEPFLVVVSRGGRVVRQPPLHRRPVRSRHPRPRGADAPAARCRGRGRRPRGCGARAPGRRRRHERGGRSHRR